MLKEKSSGLRYRWPLSVICLILFLLSGDVMALSGNPENTSSLPVTVLHQAATCGTIVDSQWISAQQPYEITFQSLFQGKISSSNPEPATVDFSKNGVLLISMGQQRTGGYSVTLAVDQMQISDGRAKIQVVWNTRKPGTMAIQMLTNPCLMLEVPKGNYSVIDVQDQVGNTRMSISVN